MKSFIKDFYVFALGGGAYFILELVYRGYSHPVMFLVGGLCVYFLYRINIWLPDLSLAVRAVLGAVTITAIEFVSGCIINIWLGMGVWDYSSLPLNLFGQISLLFSFFWFLLCLPAAGLLSKVAKT